MAGSLGLNGGGTAAAVPPSGFRGSVHTLFRISSSAHIEHVFKKLMAQEESKSLLPDTFPGI